MKTVILHPGQIVYAIEGFEIVEATVVRVESRTQITLLSEYTSYKERQKTYGIDFFITKNKASEVLKLKLENHKAFMKTKSFELNKDKEKIIVDERTETVARLKERAEVCNSCGIPIGRFSHCGCSH